MVFYNKYSNLGGGIIFWFLTWKEELTVFPMKISVDIYTKILSVRMLLTNPQTETVH